MVTIMDMTNGNALDEFGQFAEEVLNAGGLPQALFEQLGLQETQTVRRGSRSTPVAAPDQFLDQMYRFQE